MSNIYYLNHYEKEIEGKKFFCFRILDLKNTQIFTFYHISDDKSKNFVANVKTFQDISDRLTLVIKRNNKISFDLK